VKKMDHAFIQDSFWTHTQKLMTGPLLNELLQFSSYEKDQINEETIELLEPYLGLTDASGELKLFDPDVAKVASSALWGLCTWAGAMSDYHKQSKIVKPKLHMLEVKTVELEEAQEKLREAQEQLEEVNRVKAELRGRFDACVANKEALAEAAAKTRKKMEQANRLINSLQDNKGRWINSRDQFKATKMQLIGDVAKACAFVSYCGPFNSPFRLKLINEYFGKDLTSRGIPLTPDLEMTNFLVNQSTVGEWNLQGLPNDDLSVQNGIMVTRSTRYPLMIDPQSQAINWIKRKEPIIMERDFIYTLSNPNLKDRLKIPLQDGDPVMIENIENEVDPMLDPLLERQFTVRGRQKFIKIADTEMDYDPNFRLYMTSRLGNPHFSPELAAKTTIIDFTVTQDGLEQQLLGRLISKEQKYLEDQLQALNEDVTFNTKML
jgi:dynein heavy chain